MRTDNPSVHLQKWGAKLEAFYYEHFPECHFSRFAEMHDKMLQDAFQKAVKKSDKDGSRCGVSNDLRSLFKELWFFIKEWHPEDDKAVSHYIVARYLHISAWTGIPLEPGLDPTTALRRALVELDLCAKELELDTERLHWLDLTKRVTRLKLSVAQFLEWQIHRRPVGATQVLDRSSLASLLEYLVSKITSWPFGHFERWQRARDAVTISSALGVDFFRECASSYEILIGERPQFLNRDDPEWAVGDPADYPDLAFFREIMRQILEFIKEGNKPCA